MPCPLCGALEHPYGQQHPLLESHNSQHETSLTEQTRQQIINIDMRIDNMTHELSDCQSQYAGKQNQLQNESNQLATLRMQAQTLCSDINSYIENNINSDTAINTIVQPISDMNNKILSVTQYLGDAADSISTDPQLLSHLLSTVNDVKAALSQEKKGSKVRLTNMTASLKHCLRRPKRLIILKNNSSTTIMIIIR
ncbi:hypothetical protein [Psychrobacter sp. WY6]|uniref:hypothetical protein n=1 Tax=Psychrobacter sp. WY6 TaxID=2708350 RepID=UPI002022D2CB|nr:hypothetical protein [Psychrobacter sp. WY6]